MPRLVRRSTHAGSWYSEERVLPLPSQTSPCHLDHLSMCLQCSNQPADHMHVPRSCSPDNGDRALDRGSDSRGGPACTGYHCPVSPPQTCCHCRMMMQRKTVPCIATMYHPEVCPFSSGRLLCGALQACRVVLLWARHGVRLQADRPKQSVRHLTEAQHTSAPEL